VKGTSNNDRLPLNDRYRGCARAGACCEEQLGALRDVRPVCKPQPPVMLFRSLSGLAMVRSVSKPSPVPRIFTLP
jgi:hypothetical protein